MIRFKTIDAGASDKPAEKPAAPAPATATTEAAVPADDAAPEAKAKDLKRKTPLRAKKPDAARLFRD